MTGPSESGKSKVGPNPYVGPRSFEEDEEANFFGRDEETAILEGLVMARRATLFFAQSGAGKSSLLKAGLIPRLTRQMMIGRGKRQRIYQKMQVLPVASVGGTPPENLGDSIANIYVFNALFSLNPQADPETLVGQTLSAGLAASILAKGRSSAITPTSSKRVNDPSQPPHGEPSALSETYQQGDTDPSTPSVPHRPDISPSTPEKEISALFILDQFEELFTQHPAHWLEREDFFHQVGQALRDQPDLRVLFTMREDYIAELTPFAHLLPDELRSRFRLEPL